MSIDVREKVMEVLREVLTEEGDRLDHLDPDEDLGRLGINSVTFIRLVLGLEMELGVSWDDDALGHQHFMTLNSIVRYVENSLAASA